MEILQDVLKRDPPPGAGAAASLYLGLALERQGSKAEAADAYRAALKGQAPASAAGVWLARLVVGSDPAEAVALAGRAAEQYPQSTRARQVLLAALLAANKLDQAAAVGETLLVMDPANPLTTRLLAEAAAKAGRGADAKALEDRTIRLLAGEEKAAAGLEADLRWVKGQ